MHVFRKGALTAINDTYFSERIRYVPIHIGSGTEVGLSEN